MVLGNDGLSLSGPRYAASHPGTLSKGADAVLGRGGLYGDSPAPAEEYTVEHKRRGEKSRPHRRFHVREDLARGNPCSPGDVHPPLVALAGLRSDLGQVADFLSKWDAAALRDWILSFGSFSPAVYFLVVVAQVIVSPIPGGPVTFVAARVGRSSRGASL